MPNDRRLNIAVISNATSIPSDIDVAWTSANVCLEGPYCANAVQGQTIFSFTTAVIDVRYGADVILSLTGKLDEHAIPYLFYVAEELAGAGQGPFILSRRPEDIEGIVAALIDQGAGLKH